MEPESTEGSSLVLASTLPAASAMGANAGHIFMWEPVTVATFRGSPLFLECFELNSQLVPGIQYVVSCYEVPFRFSDM